MNWKRLIATGAIAATVALASASSAFASDGGRGGGGSGSGRGGDDNRTSSTISRSSTSGVVRPGAAPTIPGASTSAKGHDEQNEDENEPDEINEHKGNSSSSSSSSTIARSSTSPRVRVFNCNRANGFIANADAHLARLTAAITKLETLAADATAAGDTEKAEDIAERIDHVNAKIDNLTARLAEIKTKVTANCV